MSKPANGYIHMNHRFEAVGLLLHRFSLLWLKAMAEESGDGEKVKVIQDELNELEERAEALDRQRTKNISAIRYTHTHISPQVPHCNKNRLELLASDPRFKGQRSLFQFGSPNWKVLKEWLVLCCLQSGQTCLWHLHIFLFNHAATSIRGTEAGTSSNLRKLLW